eukprot:TRINITY_DN12586_c0_g1_i1.p1 TRINITY_DN12586_c0_g1~~TRINITY_DN12586_c0_g1_i1.p1  ORF type:complete len:362 (-),score=42.92 TRINITY_DN12586_c0_g1_i1:76-1161(-)
MDIPTDCLTAETAVAKRPRIPEPDGAGLPAVRETTPLEVYNIPLFEIPPLLDVRAHSSFCASHIVCAVSVPAEDGLDPSKLFQRILDHDEEWGWCLQHPFTIVYDDDTQERADWLARLLCQTVQTRTGLSGFDGADNQERLLRRLAFQCKRLLLLRYDDFKSAFGFCCTAGPTWTATEFFERLGPLPRCALLQPRIFIGGRQTKFTPQLLQELGISRVVVNGGYWDILDGTSGGASAGAPGRPVDAAIAFADRPSDVDGISTAPCSTILEGAANFLAGCLTDGSAGLVRVHGQSRSASVVVALLRLTRQLSVDAAWEILLRSGIRLDGSLVWWNALREMPMRKAGLALENNAFRTEALAEQ